MLLNKSKYSKFTIRTSMTCTAAIERLATPTEGIIIFMISLQTFAEPAAVSSMQTFAAVLNKNLQTFACTE